MKISADTKISRLLREGDDMVDFIISIHPKFSKLSNPFLRKAIAPRVTVRDAARIAGMDVNELLKKLAAKGFEVELSSQAPEAASVDSSCRVPRFRRVSEIDAASMLERGEDPFDPIRKALLELQPGEAVKIVLDFVPSPLIDIFSRQGYESCVLTTEDGMFQTYFYKPLRKKSLWEKIKSLFKQKTVPDDSAKGGDADEKTFAEILKRYEGKLEKIDVRDLEMPQPMMRILESLKNLPPGKALYVDHKRIPQFLIPELEKKGYHWVAKRENPDYTRMIIFKPETHD